MKAKYALIALLAITFFGCDDNTAGLGLGMFPGSDQNINGKLTTYDVTTESVPAGQIYAKSNIGYVGKFTDDLFGTYQAGFLSELNCTKGMTFPGVYNGTAFDSDNKLTQTMVGEDGDDKDKEDITFVEDNGKIIGNIHTIELYLWYSSYFGDSLTASRLSVYELGGNGKETLNKDNAYYTNIDPNDFYDPQNILGTKAYTAVDLSVKDSIRKLSTYVPSVHVSFEKDAAIRIGKEIIKKAYKSGTNFDRDKLKEAFKGIYVKGDYGDGTILYIDDVQMNVVYKCYAVDSITGLKLKKKVLEENETTPRDSTYYGYRMFNSTREVIQANGLDNDQAAMEDCINNPDLTYIKSPAGIFTQVTIPVSEIAEKLQGDTLNAVKLGIPIYNETNEKKFGMSKPRSVLLIRKKYKDTFFEKNQLSDGTISSLFDYSNNTLSFTQYTFNNITQMINNCLADREAAKNLLPMTFKVTDPVTNVEETKTATTIEEWEEYSEWNKFVLIPVLVTKDSSSSNNYYGTSTSNVISIQHDLKPGYVRLKGGTKKIDGKPDPNNVLKLEVVSTNFGTKSK
ncbi:DUF4270 domain-containing protein [Bacteroides sp. GM023]|uniref:DUF4270 domain-containing protein n=1 Tax=Bacteroides sp. GM023 TaxID=2723058 RepID=UPI00168AC6ED|nr:DUF4270 domain-containing protein [Bacteroides sp. GM023]MBD3591432.1 DUF4270 domain-containing protein [Bacteroides sp. GM023]